MILIPTVYEFNLLIVTLVVTQASEDAAIMLLTSLF